jgi:hypothetical protein
MNRDEQVEQYRESIANDVWNAMNDITAKYQDFLGITDGGTSIGVTLDTETPTESIINVLKDQAWYLD